MSEIQKFTTTNTTITIDNATTLQFNRNKCDQIDAPFIFATAYRCKEYVLLHELQGFLTDEIIEPKTPEEFQQGLHTQDNPYYLDIYDSLHDSLSIKENTLQGNDLYDRLSTYEKESLKYFHLFKVDESSWIEVELDLLELENNGFAEWEYFTNGMVKNEKS